LKKELREAECSHLALMVDRSYVVRHISYTHEACLTHIRGQLMGERCYEVLWNLEMPCSECPMKKQVPLDTTSIISHFQQGISAQIEDTVSESLLPLSNHQDPLFIVLLEPILQLPIKRGLSAKKTGSISQNDLKDMISAEAKNKEVLSPSAFEDLAASSTDKTYLLHLYYHRLFYPHFSSYGLTHTEQEVALSILKGFSSKQIAERLFISKKSVDFHRHNIRKKLGLTGKRVSIANFLKGLLQKDSM